MSSPTFQHRHFAALARWLRDDLRHDFHGDALAADVVANSLADALARTNPRFDRARFLRAADPAQQPDGRDRR